MNLLPASVIINRWHGALSRLEFGVLHFVSPTGEKTTFTGSKPGPEATFAIADWSVISRMAERGDVAMGEDYIAGLWETPNIETLFSLFLLNLKPLEGFANGNRINRLALSLHNRLLRRNSKKGSSKNIQAHYDVGNAFYSLWLDKSMTYSSGLYSSPSASLEQAQINKYQRILNKFEADNASVLEIGCGWGGFAEQAASANHHVTGITISPAQHAFATERMRNNADIRLQDYRDVQGTFDMIVSIEMFEAVGERYWPTYFNTLKARLKRSGKAIVQTISVHDDIFDDYRTRSDFIRHYVFPGGVLPSLKRFREEAARAGLKCVDAFTFGHDYAQTLRQWSARLDAASVDIKILGYDEAFMRNWRYYLGMCAAAFAVGRTDVAQMELVHAA
jgi:cyclopropane-fatty-acyl-phospholipid synthase